MNIMDMMSLNGLFTAEANKEAAEVINGFRGVFDSKGSNMMSIGKEAILAIYRATR
jgi:hypothetical protein